MTTMMMMMMVVHAGGGNSTIICFTLHFAWEKQKKNEHMINTHARALTHTQTTIQGPAHIITMFQFGIWYE